MPSLNKIISIVVPAYNVDQYIGVCIESILAQDYSDWELILVDDGSTDDTGAVCDSYAAKDSRIHVIHKSNGGLSSARNAGLSIVTSRYVAFVDGDDLLQPWTLGWLNSVLRKAKSMGVRPDFIQYDYVETADSSYCAEQIPDEKLDFVFERDEMFNRLYALGGSGASACTKLYSVDTIGNLRFKEGIINEDEQFNGHFLLRVRQAVYSRQTPYLYINRQNSIITSSFSRKRLDVIDIMHERIELLQKNRLPRRLVELTYRRLFMTMLRFYVEARRAGDAESQKRCVDEMISIAHEQRCLKLNGIYDWIKQGQAHGIPMHRAYYHIYNIRHK